MNRQELLSKLSEKNGMTKKDNDVFLTSFTEAVTEELAQGGDVSLVGFGKFSVVERAERIGRNPQSGEEIIIKASKAPKFKAGKVLKEATNN